jgi:hypothetical protein
MNDRSPVEAVLRSLKTAERHVDSEYVDDHAETLASVSREPRYAMMPKPGVVKVICDGAGVAQFYEDARDAFLPGASRIVAQIATDWYVFLENVPTRIDAVSLAPRTLHTATLFPKAPDGIRGEFLWERSVSDPAPDFHVPHADGPVPHASVRNLQIHERYLGALLSGDNEEIGELLDRSCIWAERNYLPDATERPMLELVGADAVVDSLACWRSAFRLERISILNRLVTDWYVFAEELLVMGDAGDTARRQYRRAAIYPITPTGKIQGTLAYGTDIEPASPTAEHELGAAFWERAGPHDAKDPGLRRRSSRQPRGP